MCVCVRKRGREKERGIRVLFREGEREAGRKRERYMKASASPRAALRWG